VPEKKAAVKAAAFSLFEVFVVELWWDELGFDLVVRFRI
jgi:hypothetical protein